MPHEHEDDVNLKKLKDYRWAQFILQSIYEMFFRVFLIKLKMELYKDYYAVLTNCAVYLLEDLKRKKEVDPSENSFCYVIEACGYYGKTDKVLAIV